MQVWHAPPRDPHAALLIPISQKLPAQHPIGQVVVLQTPGAPVIPDEPATPVVPVIPAAPVTPVPPVIPVPPALPVAPVTPVAPLDPAAPVSPEVPVPPEAPLVPTTNSSISERPHAAIVTTATSAKDAAHPEELDQRERTSKRRGTGNLSRQRKGGPSGRGAVRPDGRSPEDAI